MHLHPRAVTYPKLHLGVWRGPVKISIENRGFRIKGFIFLSTLLDTYFSYWGVMTYTRESTNLFCGRSIRHANSGWSSLGKLIVYLRRDSEVEGNLESIDTKTQTIPRVFPAMRFVTLSVSDYLQEQGYLKIEKEILCYCG